MGVFDRVKYAAHHVGKAVGFTWYSGYDATKPKGRRQAPTGLVRDEDRELPVASRRALLSATRDIHRNFAIAAWAIRRHLDYVTKFRFKAKTGNKELDAKIERLVAEAGKAENFDVAGRHSLAMSVRMSEARRVVDGDIVWYKLRDGKTQVIEGDRIATPYAGLPGDINPMYVCRGIKCDKAGKAESYVLCSRARTNDIGFTGQDLQFEALLPARLVYLHACYDLGRFDQVRGITPLASAYNSYRDVYEGIDYALAKMKVSQIFGIKIMRNAAPEAESLGEVGIETAPDHFGDQQAQYSPDGAGQPSVAVVAEQPKYQVDPGRGPFMLDLDDGDQADIMESRTPSAEMQTFIPLVVSIALKSLDIPFSWYDEAYVNFSGGKQATINYNKSADVKRGEVKELLNNWTKWRLGIMQDDGELQIPEGTELIWEWQPAGTPWLDPLKEAVSNIAAIGACLESAIDIAEENTGRSMEEILDDNAEVIRMCDERGLPRPSWAVAPAQAEADKGDVPEAPAKDPTKSGARKPGTSQSYETAFALASLPEAIEQRINGNGRLNGHSH